MHPEGNKVEPEGTINSDIQPSQIASIQPGALRQRLNSSGLWLGLTAILLLATALRLVLRLGLSNRDSFNYMLAAMKLNEYGVVHYLSDLSNIYENRLSIVFPLALIFRLIGTTEIATTLLPFAAALLTIILVFVFAYRTSVRAGFIAALIVATLPLAVGLSTSVLPDSLIPFYTGVCLFCLWIGLQRDSFWLFVLSGVFLFFAFQSRATSGVLVIPLILIALWSSGRSLKAIITPTGTFIVLLGALWLILFMVAGDALVQYKLLIHDGSMKNFAGTGEFLGYFRDTVTRLNPDFGVLFHLAILALIFAVYRSRGSEKYRLPLVAFTFLYFFFEFGSTSLTTYQPIWKLSRFLTVLIVPVALLIALASHELLSKKSRAIRYISLFIVVDTIIIRRDLRNNVWRLYNESSPSGKEYVRKGYSETGRVRWGNGRGYRQAVV